MAENQVTGLLRLAVIADLAEENWPSMDLVAEMLAAHLHSRHAAQFQTELLRPPMKRRFSGSGEGKLGRNIDRLCNRMYDYPRWLRSCSHAYDRFHIADHSYAHLVHVLPPERTAVTCHDLDTFRCLLDPQADPRPVWFRTMAQRILSGLQRASHVACVSRTVRDEILAHGLIPSERLSVTPNGVDPSCSPMENELADRQAAELLAGSAPDSLLILHVGSTIARKRIDVLLRILAAVAENKPNVRLIRVGGALTGDQRRLAEELGVSGKILTMPFVDRYQLAALYRRAALVVQPSETEGFGLPVIEAMACGTVVLASDIPVFREVAADAGVYSPLEDISAWAATACRLLAERENDPAAWQRRRMRCQAQAAGYSWSATAAAVAAIHGRQTDLIPECVGEGVL